MKKPKPKTVREEDIEVIGGIATLLTKEYKIAGESCENLMEQLCRPTPVMVQAVKAVLTACVETLSVFSFGVSTAAAAIKAKRDESKAWESLAEKPMFPKPKTKPN
jgi:hypothetical protein